MSYQVFKSIKNTFWKNNKSRWKHINDLDYEVIEFHVCKKDFSKIERKNNICINVFYENNLVYPVIYQMKNLKIVWSHTMSILKILTDLCAIWQKIIKNTLSIV